MEQASAQTIATFNGVLLRRERALEQKFVQLVFREDDKDWLCVSTDPRMATLPVGQNYRIEGEFKQRGERAFVYNPKIAVLKKHWRPIRRVAFAVALVTCVSALGGVAYMHQHGTAVSSGQNTKPVPSITPASSQTTSSVQPAATPTTPVSTPAAISTTPVVAAATHHTTSKPKTTRPVVPAVTPATVTAPQSATTQSSAATTDATGSTDTTTPTATDVLTNTPTDQTSQPQDQTPPVDTGAIQPPSS